jgi:ABC-type multidrug transport system permease subunit
MNNHITHPFLDQNDLSKKSTEELQNAITSLYQKMTFANRMNNQIMANQIQMVINSYNIEFKKRMDEMYKKQNIDQQINISNDSKN